MDARNQVVMSQVMLPHQANVAGNVHGGEIMKFMDMAAGACAMIMEWILNQPIPTRVTTSQVANIIILGAQQNTFSEFPNRQWGYGTMDLYQSLDRLRRL